MISGCGHAYFNPFLTWSLRLPGAGGWGGGGRRSNRNSNRNLFGSPPPRFSVRSRPANNPDPTKRPTVYHPETFPYLGNALPDKRRLIPFNIQNFLTHSNVERTAFVANVAKTWIIAKHDNEWGKLVYILCPFKITDHSHHKGWPVPVYRYHAESRDFGIWTVRFIMRTCQI